MGDRWRRRRGFILLFGSKNVVSNDAMMRPARGRCPRCGREAEMVGKSARTWFTIFFIPIFPMSKKKVFTQCSACGAQFGAAPARVAAAVVADDSRQRQMAIGMYNSLRASPANSVTLNELMHLYATMNEFDEAVSAAGQFPQALNNSEQCMTTLGRVYLAKGMHGEAVKWFDAALARNPALGEANYFKALAHMTASPPDYEAAVGAARAARGAGYPGAEGVLRDAEARRRG